MRTFNYTIFSLGLISVLVLVVSQICDKSKDQHFQSLLDSSTQNSARGSSGNSARSAESLA